MRGNRAHVALTLIAAAITASAGSASVWAQSVTSPFIEPNPNVTVDLSVLDGLGSSSGLAVPGNYATPGYGAQGAGVGAPAGVPTFLVRPDAPRYAAPPPEVQALLQGRSGAAPAAAAPMARSAPAAAPTPARPAAPARTASAPPPPAAAAPAPTPPPAPTPVASTRSSAAAAAAVPPPPSVQEPSRIASAAPPPPPPVVPRSQPAQPVSAPPAPAIATTSAPAAAPATVPSSQSASGDTTRIAFPGGQSQLPADAGAKLDPVISRLKQDDKLRVQLMAYADGDQDGANKARRLSLSRALAVRAYLIDNEIASTRMDVRALGNRADDGPADRVDLVVINR
ncbi:MAG: OmpA family protein [Alphaproteobacteria bacterium]|nr:OmpA family protein [Alphaproteobacteria bacterium]